LYLGYGFYFLGGILAMLNFYLSFLRHRVHRLLGKPDGTYRFVSGILLFGVLSAIGLMHLPENLYFGIGALIFLIVDTGGIPWLIRATWKDDSLWNPKKFVCDQKQSRDRLSEEKK